MLQLEDPAGLLMFGLRREVLEDTLAEPEEVLEGIEAVTAADVQRLARQVIVDDGLNFALVGPFDDPQRFLDAMAGQSAGPGRQGASMCARSAAPPTRPVMTASAPGPASTSAWPGCRTSPPPRT